MSRNMNKYNAILSPNYLIGVNALTHTHPHTARWHAGRPPVYLPYSLPVCMFDSCSTQPYAVAVVTDLSLTALLS